MAGLTANASTNSTNVVGVHYQVSEKIGEGSFGIIFEGEDQIDGRKVAIKFEPRKTPTPQLRDEYRSYNILDGCHGIPKVYYFGQDGLHNILVLDLLGPSLEDLFDLCGRQFNVVTVAALAIQMITRVQTIHEHNLIYRDIKPDNFLVHADFWNNKEIFIVDFGMAKQYRDPRTKTHIPYRERKSLSGTARYMSINTHLGREQSRRDDLEALGHVFMYFLRGQLPWQGLKAQTNEKKYEMIGNKKRTTSLEDLCKGYPDEFRTYLSTVRNLGFTDQPDYEHLRNLMQAVLKRERGNHYDFQWLVDPNVGKKFPHSGLQSSAVHSLPQSRHVPMKPLAQTPSQRPTQPVYGSGLPGTPVMTPATHLPKPLPADHAAQNPERAEHRTFFQKFKSIIFCSCSS